MLCNFPWAEPAPRDEPRNRLKPGGAYWRRSRTEPAASQAPPLVVPASAREFALHTLAFPADGKQQEILATAARRIVVCCTRQWGKSTTAAVKVLHHALTNPGSLTLLASRTRRQAGELLRKVTAFAKTLDLAIPRAPGHPDSLLLPNAARVIALPGSPEALRGFSAVTLLVIDEAAFVSDDLYHALRPMLATTNGELWLLSTPRGRKGFFYDEWESPGEFWAKFSVTAIECPRIAPAFLEEERRLHGPATFRREYLCDFGHTGESCFDIDALDAAACDDRYRNSQEFADAVPGNRFYIGFDVGQKQSHSAIVILECVSGPSGRRDAVTFNPIQQASLFIRRVERFPLHCSYDDMARRLQRAIQTLGGVRDARLMVDATGCGQPFIEILRKHRIGAWLMPIHITSGGTPTYANAVQRIPKKDLIASANYVLTHPAMSVVPGLPGFAELREEMEAYRTRKSVSGHESYRTAKSDDLVMAFALAAWGARKFLPTPPEPGAATRPL